MNITGSLHIRVEFASATVEKTDFKGTAFRMPGLLAAACMALLALLTTGGGLDAAAQPIPVGDVRELQLRLGSLYADTSDTVNGEPGYKEPGRGIAQSQLIRPLWMPAGVKRTDRPAGFSMWRSPDPYAAFPLGEAVKMGVYDLELGWVHNTELPYSENDGAAWFGRGTNYLAQGGFFVTSDWFTLSVRPQLSHARNLDFERPRFVPFDRTYIPRYAPEGFVLGDSLAERIDAPYRFGPEVFTTFDWGHSSLRLHHGPLELGAGTENLWWGPGQRYTLMMSNHAAGVPHAFVGTRTPIRLPGRRTGSVEMRWMLGLPRDSEYFDFGWVDFTPEAVKERQRKFLRQRVMNGLHVVWSPGFVPGLHVGYARFTQNYIEDGRLRMADVTRVWRPFPKPDWDKVYSNFRADQSTYERINTASMSSLRWVFPSDHAEVYVEFYKESVHENLRDWIQEPQHDRAYNVGFQKLTPSRRPASRLDFSRFTVEFTNLTPTRIDDIRPQTYLYTHKYVKQGHTNGGQVLGAAIGTGADSQFLGYDLFFQRAMLGIYAQRVTVNDQFHMELNQRYVRGNGYKEYKHHWFVLNLGLKGAVQRGGFTLMVDATWNKHYNYGREFFLKYVEWLDREFNDILNLRADVRMRYAF